MFQSLLEKVQSIRRAIEAGDYKTATDLFIDLQRQAFDLFLGDRKMAATGGGEEGHAELKEEINGLIKVCKKAQKEATPKKGTKAAAGDNVGKIGDGKILELFLQALPAILALFRR